jgi:hypothetical protein
VWDDLVRNLAKYPSAVLTVHDSAGYPFSIRCVPRPDAARQVLEVDLPGYVGAQAGPAGLLCHYHDDNLWNMTNFVAYGELEPDGGLEPDGQAWVLRVRRMLEGAGPKNSFRTQLRPRASAKRYIAKHDMQWPPVPWDRLHAIYQEARR